MKLSLHPSNEWMQSNNTTDNENAWIQLYERNYGQPWHWCPSTSRSPRFLFPCERVPFIYLAGVPRALRRNAALSINIPDWPPKFQDSLPLKMTQFDEFSPSFNLATKRDYNVTYIFLSAQIKETARLRNFHRRRISLFVWNLRMIIWQHVLLSCTRSKNLRDLEKITSAVEWPNSSSKPLNRRIILFNKITRPSYYFPRGRNSS